MAKNTVMSLYKQITYISESGRTYTESVPAHTNESLYIAQRYGTKTEIINRSISSDNKSAYTPKEYKQN